MASVASLLKENGPWIALVLVLTGAAVFGMYWVGNAIIADGGEDWVFYAFALGGCLIMVVGGAFLLGLLVPIADEYYRARLRRPRP